MYVYSTYYSTYIMQYIGRHCNTLSPNEAESERVGILGSGAVLTAWLVVGFAELLVSLSLRAYTSTRRNNMHSNRNRYIYMHIIYTYIHCNTDIYAIKAYMCIQNNIYVTHSIT